MDIEKFDRFYLNFLTFSYFIRILAKENVN